MNLLASHGSGDEQILVYETDLLFGERGSFRVLQFADEAVQGAIDLELPKRIVFEYPRALIHLMEHNDDEGKRLENLFIIGHGIGTLSNYFSSKTCVTAEVSEAVATLSRQYFGWSGKHLHIGDGREVLEHEQRLYDYIVLDAFTSKGIPQHLATLEFFAMAQSKLTPQGALLINVTGRGKQDVKANAVYRTMQEVFAFTNAFTLQATTERDIRNSIFVGSNTQITYRLRSMAGFVPYVPEAGYVMYD